MPGYPPTPEQQAAIDAFQTHKNMTLEAGAGTGKTSTLKFLAEAGQGRRGLYLAFNRSVADEAAREFPKNVDCINVHRIAWHAVVKGTYRMARMGGPRQTGRDLANILGLRGPHRINDKVILAPNQVARLAMETVTRFCQSADDRIEFRHLARQMGIDSYEDRRRLGQVVLPIAEKAWVDIRHPDGHLKYTGDHSIKEWQLSHPLLGYDFVFVDEAQDSDRATVDVVNRQERSQVVAVGDRMQSIYAWRGAVDAMDAFGSEHHLFLTQSFRFGPLIADNANKWLELLDAELRITGTPSIESTVGPMPVPRAVLTRTNAKAVLEVMEAHRRNVRVGLVGGGDAVLRLAAAAEDLRTRGWTSHPELCGFQSWGAVQDYVEHDHGGQDLRTFVHLIDEHGVPAINLAIGNTVDAREADLIVTTVHKAKGLEWPTVRVATDFYEPTMDPETAEERVMPQDEGMLAYVAVTRARHHLDNTGLAFVDRLLQQKRASDKSWAALGVEPGMTGADRARAVLAAAVPAEPAKCGALLRGYANVGCILTPGHYPGTLHDAGVFAPYGDDKVAIPA